MDAEPYQPFNGFSYGGSEKQGNLAILRTRPPTALVERSRQLLGEEEINCPFRASEKLIQRVEGFLGRYPFERLYRLLRAKFEPLESGRLCRTEFDHAKLGQRA